MSLHSKPQIASQLEVIFSAKLILGEAFFWVSVALICPQPIWVKVGSPQVAVVKLLTEESYPKQVVNTNVSRRMERLENQRGVMTTPSGCTEMRQDITSGTSTELSDPWIWTLDGRQ